MKNKEKPYISPRKKLNKMCEEEESYLKRFGEQFGKDKEKIFMGIKKWVQKDMVKHPNNLQYVHTPFFLFNCIINKIRDEIILDCRVSGGKQIVFDDKKICVFNLEAIALLCYVFGVSSRQICFVTDNRKKKAYAENKFSGVEFKTIKEFLEQEVVMKFDIILGNPPYQLPKERKSDAVTGTCGGELWDRFVKKSLELVKEDGFVALVHPPKWRKPDHDIFPLIQEKDLKYLEMHDINDGIKTFGGTSTAYDWYVLRNSKYSGKTIIKDVNGCVEEIDISKLHCIPSGSFELFCRLLAKEGEEKCKVVYNRTNYGHDKTWMSKEKTIKNKYPCVYGLTQRAGLKLRYSEVNNKGHFGIRKVIIPLSKYTDAFIDKDGEYGICEFAFGIRFDTLREAEGIKSGIMSEEFKAIWQATEWIGNSKEWRIFKSFKRNWWGEFCK